MRFVLAALCLTLSASSVAAQENSDEAQATKKKSMKLVGLAWLKQFEGTWATAYNGTMQSRVIADKWLVSEISFNNATFSVQTLGWDKERKKFVGTWVDGTSSHVWIYSGKLAESANKILLEAEGPDMKDPAIMRLYRDSYEFVSKDKVATLSEYRDDKGKWVEYSKAEMTRKP